MKCRTKTQARETTKTRKHIQQNTHKKHQKNKKQTQTKSWKNTRVPLELAKSEPDEVQRQRWTELMMEGGSYTTCSILAKGGMGAAFKVSMAHDRSERCVKIAQDEHAEALKED